MVASLGTTLATLLANKPLLTTVLRYHVLTTVLPDPSVLAAAGMQSTLLSPKTLQLSGT